MKNLKIYFTSDLHGYVYPTDYIDRSQKNTEFDVHPIAKIFNIAFPILSKNIWYLLRIICIPSASGYFKNLQIL